MARVAKHEPPLVTTEATWALYYRENGKWSGWSVISVAPKMCGEERGGARRKDEHVFFLPRGDNGDGRICACGRFRIKRLNECPTCNRQYYSFAEPVAETAGGEK